MGFTRYLRRPANAKRNATRQCNDPATGQLHGEQGGRAMVLAFRLRVSRAALSDGGRTRSGVSPGLATGLAIDRPTVSPHVGFGSRSRISNR